MVENEKQIIDDIIKKRRLPYSVEILEVEGNKYTVMNNFGTKVVYIKEGEDYVLQ